ncbi:MAG: hypothetical protein K2Q01_04675 [Rickettsiales bacterium]|nr:hypothetical protein [Rickettsiales bacterium]
MIYAKCDKFEHESEQRYKLGELNAHYKAAGFTVVDQLHAGLAAYVIAVSAFCFPRFCIGSPALIAGLMRLERPFYRSWLGKKFSFCTFTLLRNDGA